MNKLKTYQWLEKLLKKVFLIIPFLFLNPFALIPSLIILYFVVLPFLKKHFLETNGKSFYDLQQILPTSKIRSIAVGLAEIKGKAKIIEPVISKISKQECIGYIYTIESISFDDEGRESYSIIFHETICNPFFVEDETGKIKVSPKKLKFINFEITNGYRDSNKRYTEHLLRKNMKVLLIGKADLTENNEFIFKKEQVNDVYGIAPLHNVILYNKFKPLMRSVINYFVYWIIIVVIILLKPIRIKNDTIQFQEKSKKVETKKIKKKKKRLYEFTNTTRKQY